ncbi:MAG: PorT family protein [Bacteroidales bacterium]|nr:PorT family protein [Bacteroidales bacterium]
MRRHLLTILLIAILLGFGAPERASAQVAFGVKVAGNAVSLDNFQDFQGGFDIGLFLRLGKAFYVQPELCYSLRNTNFRDIVGEIHDNCQMRQHFLDVPVLLGCHFVNKNLFKMHVVLGPRVAVLVNNQFVEAVHNREVNSHLQWGAQIGLGIDVWRFTLDGRYDIAADRTTSNDPRARIQNMFVLSLGFKLIK